MQLRALDEKGQIIFAHQAEKQRDFFCIECGGIIRARAGVHRQAHFYHLHPPASCRQNGKSMEHLQVQCFLKNILGENCKLEQPFLGIGRIADCVWEPHKLVFEVQCSPISQNEVAGRNQDYAAAGYRVIWILHDRLFNQRRLSAAELWLQKHPHYFTNIDQAGGGCIYDQINQTERGWRRILLKPVPVDLRSMYVSVGGQLQGVLRERHQQWQCGFKGDWVSLFQDTGRQKQILGALQAAMPEMGRTALIKRLWRQCVVRPYKALFDFFLEGACR